MNTGPATTANAAPVEEGHGEDEQAPPDEHLAEVVGVAGVPPEAARDEAPAVLVPRREARLLRVGHGLDQEAGRPERHAGDRPRPGSGRVVTAEKVGDRQHHDGDRDRLQEPEAGEAQRLVPHLVEAVVDPRPQDAAEQIAAEAYRPDEDEQRGGELNRLPGARDGRTIASTAKERL